MAFPAIIKLATAVAPQVIDKMGDKNKSGGDGNKKGGGGMKGILSKLPHTKLKDQLKSNVSGGGDSTQGGGKGKGNRRMKRKKRRAGRRLGRATGGLLG